MGDVPALMPGLPGWYTFNDNGNCNQYMWLDEGTTLDYAINSGSWHSQGFDTMKHILVTRDHGYLMVKDEQSKGTWPFEDQTQPIFNYELKDQQGVCQFGAEDRKDKCAKQALFDFSKANVVPKITGIWDVESAGDSWTGDNGVQYKLSFYCRNYVDY